MPPITGQPGAKFAFVYSHDAQVPRAHEERSESLTPLMGVGKETVASMDWLGRPADDRHDLGGWICSLCAIGAFWLSYSSFFGIAANLVIYLVDVWDESNAVAANTVNNVFGTALVFSFVGAFASDAYIGRLWCSVLFEILAFISCLSITLVHTWTRDGSASGSNASKTALICFIYVMALTSGSTYPSLQSLGADQLRLDQKGRYFTMVAMSISAGQIFATTVVTYLDSKELWTWSFWLCTTAAGAAIAVSLSSASNCRQYRTGGNLLVRVAQVLVAATLNRKVETALYPSLLHETQGELSAIPGCRKLRYTDSLRCLDKAATKSSDAESPWRLCTVTQVEEVKCLVRVMPVGLSSMCLMTVNAQMSTLFVEQAATMNGKLAGGVSIAPVSMHLFAIAGSLLTGFLQNTPCARLLATSLQRQGASMLMGVVAIVTAAMVETHRLRVANSGGAPISIMWLAPQYFLLGVASNLMYSGSLAFFYSEVSDGTRTISTSIAILFQGLGNYLSSILVLLVTCLSTTDNNQGWIPDDLDNGHVDYFYWFLASFLAFSSGVFLVFALFYTYREVDSGL